MEIMPLPFTDWSNVGLMISEVSFHFRYKVLTVYYSCLGKQAPHCHNCLASTSHEFEPWCFPHVQSWVSTALLSVSLCTRVEYMATLQLERFEQCSQDWVPYWTYVSTQIPLAKTIIRYCSHHSWVSSMSGETDEQTLQLKHSVQKP